MRPFNNIKTGIYLGFCFALMSVYSQESHSFFQRRKNETSGKNGYMILPVAGRVAGLGVAYGGAAIVQNVFHSSTDLTAFAVGGDVSAIAVSASQIPLISHHVFWDLNGFNLRMPVRAYDRVGGKGKSSYYRPDERETGGSTALRFNFWAQRLQFFGRWGISAIETKRVFDADGHSFSNRDNYEKKYSYSRFGSLFDLTDDLYDPSRGLRFEWARTERVFNDPTMSQFYTLHLNGTGYVPIGQSVFVANYYRSMSHVTYRRSLDRADLKNQVGLNCSDVVDAGEQAACQRTDDLRLDNRGGENQYGSSGYLGGPERLRSYPVNRFSGSVTEAYGGEFRLNLTSEKKPFDVGILKGVRSHIQLAAFYETGATADPPESVAGRPWRWSTGLGMRMIFSGAVLRVEGATGEEGSEFNVFFGYPWGIPFF